MSFDDFVRDRRTQLSVLKAVEIVGQAAAQVSEDTKRASPDIAWQEIVGMRNRLVHVYFDIDLPLVWHTVRHDLPDLIARLEPLVPPEIRQVPSATIDRLIVNSPYEEPARHWRYDRTTRLFHLDEAGPLGTWLRLETPPRSTIPACSAKFRSSTEFGGGSRRGARVAIPA